MHTLPQAGRLSTAAGPAHYQRQLEGDEVLVTLADGRHFRAPLGLIGSQADGQAQLNLPLDAIESLLRPAGPGAEAVVVPLAEETLAVGVRPVETGRVRVTKRVHALEEDVETVLEQDEVQVERIPVNEYVAAAEPVEYGDDRIVIPIYEEVVVVEKRLLLKEKLVVTRHRQSARDVQTVTRRVEEAVVERLPPRGADDPAA